MNILITGIHGFVGSNLIMALCEHHTLYGLDIISPEKKGVVRTFLWEDIETTSFPMQRLPHFDAIIHLAGKAHDTKNQSAAQVYFDINTGLTVGSLISFWSLLPGSSSFSALLRLLLTV